MFDRVYRCRRCKETFARHPNPEAREREVAAARQRNAEINSARLAAAWAIAEIAMKGGKLFRNRQPIASLRMSPKGNLVVRLRGSERDHVYRAASFPALLAQLERINRSILSNGKNLSV